MSAKRVQLALVALASIAGTGFILWSGPDQLVDFTRVPADRETTLLGLFAAWALVANILVLPAGSLSLIAGGAALGSILPAAIWFLAQLATAPLLYRACAIDHGRVLGLVDKYAGRVAAGCLDRAAEDGVWTTILLRLTPVLPSAPACLIASAAGIRLDRFLLGSVLAGWVRPMYFASMGAGLGSLARLTGGTANSSWEVLWPLLVIFLMAAGTVAARHWTKAATVNPAVSPPAPGD